MKVRIKNLEELLASGFKAHGSDLMDDNDFLVVPEMLMLGGKYYDASPVGYEGHVYVVDKEYGNWNFPANSFVYMEDMAQSHWEQLVEKSE